MIALQTIGLTKHFHTTSWRFWQPPKTTVALQDVSLTVAAGELFGLIGPNGAGKTTLVKTLCTLLQPDSGDAWVYGQPLQDAATIKRLVGLVTTDERSFYWRLTGRENLAFFAALQQLPNTAERIDAVLAQLDLYDFADKPFQAYSTGMRQRLAIARALLPAPKLLFLDEPTKGLDPPSIARLHQLIRQEFVEKQGLTVFLNSHWLHEVEKLCDRVAVLAAGQVRACGTLPELRHELGLGARYQIQVSHFPNDSLQNLQNTHPNTQLLSTGVLPTIALDPETDLETLQQVLDELRKQAVQIAQIQHQPPNLEEMFGSLTTTPALIPIPTTAPSDAPPPTALLPVRSWQQRLLALGRVAAAFLRRDWQIEKSYRLSFGFQLLGMLMQLGVFYYLSGLLPSTTSQFLAPYGGSYFPFVLLGLAFQGYLGTGLASFASNLRQAQTSGTLEAMLATPTDLSTLILCSALWNYLFTTFRVVLYLTLGWLFIGGAPPPVAWHSAGLVLLLSVIVFSSLGIGAASFIMVLKRGDPVTGVLSAVATFLGGVYFPVQLLPSWLGQIAQWLPLTFALEALRQAVLQGAGLHALAKPLMQLSGYAVVCLPLGLVCFRWAVERARRDGSLTHF